MNILSRQEKVEQNLAQFWNVRDDLKTKTLSELKDVVSATRLNYAVCAINVTGDLNIGMMMRAASLLGAERFILFGSKKFDRRSTVGAQNYIDLVKFDAKVSKHSDEIDYSKFHPMMEEYMYNPIFIETGGLDITELHIAIDSSGKTPCLIFGNEGMGIPVELMEKHWKFSIPQYGVLRSLNVSSAASIAMYEISKYM